MADRDWYDVDWCDLSLESAAAELIAKHCPHLTDEHKATFAEELHDMAAAYASWSSSVTLESQRD